MKLKTLIAALLAAGLVVSIALAKAPKGNGPSTHAGTAAGTKCDQVELKGTGTAGSVSFTVTKANKRGKSLVGTTVTLTVPAGAKIKAKACTTVGSSALTLRTLHASVSPAKP